ncbi:hypothetical protein DH2020_019861 [Rehmannia glutinosa]|uniref:Phosphatidate cytidylyltransferase n=1 Tax=Rehmannia glutinosa TaxID=99300 RepID=A0ABR0WIB6_REHGL
MKRKLGPYIYCNLLLKLNIVLNSFSLYDFVCSSYLETQAVLKVPPCAHLSVGFLELEYLINTSGGVLRLRETMQRDTGSGGPSTPSGPTPRLRRRRGSNEVPPEVERANGSHLLVNDHNKYKSMLIRTYSTVWMIGGFAFIIYMGHLYIWAMVIMVSRSDASDKSIGCRAEHQHFFFTAMLFVYGRILSQRLVNTVTTDKVGTHVWCHLFVLLFFCLTILRFLLPASLIVINDIAAYIFGFFFGKTPLIKLSPKKTWEGFIGASVATMISAFLDLSTGWLQCDPGPLFKPESFAVPEWFPEWFPWREISVLPVQWHALCLGLFASIIAPFGGFFASGFKRAFKIKDFGDSIPGHGGITDRMDCQMVMAVFAYIYHQSFVVSQSLSIEMIMDQILMNLTFEEQRALYMKLGQIIVERQFGES